MTKLLLLLTTAFLPGLQAQQQADGVAPDPVVQDHIRSVIHATGEADQLRAVEELRALAGPEKRVLVPQLFHYTLAAATTRDAMAFGVLVERLSIGDDAIVRGVVPFLEGPDATATKRDHAAGLLSAFEHATPERPPSFAVYREFVEGARDGKTPPPGLTDYLFERDAGQALLLFLRITIREAEARKPFLWAQHVLADLAWRLRHGFPVAELTEAVDAQLAFLVRSDAWWARLAAVHFLETHPSFARAEWRQRLEADPDPLVRARATRRTSQGR